MCLIHPKALNIFARLFRTYSENMLTTWLTSDFGRRERERAYIFCIAYSHSKCNSNNNNTKEHFFPYFKRHFAKINSYLYIYSNSFHFIYINRFFLSILKKKHFLFSKGKNIRQSDSELNIYWLTVTCIYTPVNQSINQINRFHCNHSIEMRKVSLTNLVECAIQS